MEARASVVRWRCWLPARASGAMSIPNDRPKRLRYFVVPPVPHPASRMRRGFRPSKYFARREAAISRIPRYHQWRSSRLNRISYCSLSIESVYRLGHLGDLLVRQLRVEGQREDLAGALLCGRQAPGTDVQIPIGFLEMHRYGVVDQGANPLFRQVALQLVPPWAA